MGAYYVPLLVTEGKERASCSPLFFCTLFSLIVGRVV